MPILGIMASAISGNLFAPSGAYDSIATASGTGSSSIINFTSIPQTYSHLEIRFSAFATTTDQIVLELGTSGTIDTGANYARYSFIGQGTAASNGGNNNMNYMNIYGYAVGGSTTQPTVAVVNIYDYKNTNKMTSWNGISGVDKNGTGEVGNNSGVWTNLNAVDSIRIYSESASNFNANSKFALYGIKGA